MKTKRGRQKTTLPPDDDRFAHPAARFRVFVREDMIGAGKIALLQKVAETGSISAAAREMGLGYRRAWFLLETLQRCFAEPLLETSRGGAAAGGSRLTPLGGELVARFQAHEEAVNAAAQPLLDWLESRQRDA
ncbi:LysR family transcriptional regulator [Abyssibius alkaniclasticus]|uniref:winged helix-turn-helix domain-containing protein n=1 Tax=Abyssibius alkaniclasticus TaxID=2881234 RepID=UPI0023639A71|nr:LysR family transcriptional regulator [Abyssibius alkaniclasticus]UPH70576.1 LysR family transcriptional regulator [Abyssibius alkaniclasticus]|tara:strand:+ start:2697 stop:3095 length:399 start_codon:yes stop_codon:yes gene_type:complete